MSALFIAEVTPNDPSWLSDYGAMVPPIVRKHGGELLCRSEIVRRYKGRSTSPDFVVVLRFPSMDAIEAFMADPDYAPYKKARVDCATSDIYGIC